MRLLSKLLPLFVLPLGVSLILLVWGAARRRRGLVWAGIAVLVISSHPWVAHVLTRTAEEWGERRTAADMPAADAIVVLSAGRRLAPGPGAASEWADANRFFGGLELFHARKSPLLVFTGGAIPWRGTPHTEGQILAQYAIGFGVPADQIVVTEEVFNTAEEAREVATVLRKRFDQPRILLVTSAFHMPRAREQFRRAGLTVEPFPVGFASQAGGVTLLSLLPGVGSLAASQQALREFYGRAYYRLFDQ